MLQDGEERKKGKQVAPLFISVMPRLCHHRRRQPPSPIIMGRERGKGKGTTDRWVPGETKKREGETWLLFGRRGTEFGNGGGGEVGSED